MSRGIYVPRRFEKDAYRAFGEAATKYVEWLDSKGKDSNRAIQAFESLDPYVGSTALAEIDELALESYKRDRKEGKGAFKKSVRAGTINKELGVLRATLNKACRVWRWIPSVPLIEDVDGDEKRPYPLTWAEQRRIFSCFKNDWGGGAALFAVNTGVRAGELFGLMWKDLVPVPELDTFVFLLENKENRRTKNGEDRAVICNSLARNAVESQRTNKSKYVFPSRSPFNYGGKVTGWQNVWSRAWQTAGMPDSPLIRRGIHNLRHTYGHRLRAFGVTQEDRNALLGHANASLAEHYALPDIERLQEMSERVTECRETTILRAVQSSLGSRPV